MRAPVLNALGSFTHARRFPGVFRTAPAPRVERLIRCVRSGPNTPLPDVPRTEWQLMQASEENSSRPDLVASCSAGAVCCEATQARNSSLGCTTTTSSINACWSPQYSAHWPTYVPTRRGSIQTRFVLFGIASIFPASCGTQKLWATSTDSTVMNVSAGLAASLTGTWISFAVTIPSFG